MTRSRRPRADCLVTVPRSMSRGTGCFSYQDRKPWRTQPCRCACGDETARHAAGTAAEDRAGAELRADPRLRLRLHPLHRRAVVHQLQAAAGSFASGSASATIVRLFEPSELDHGAQEPRDLRHRSTSSSARCSGSVSRSCSTRRSAAKVLLRPIYLYPMALSFIVTGVAWKWFLDPGIGLEHAMHRCGWESFSFRWIKEGKMAIYTIVIAAVWQSSGFVMAMFLAGLARRRQRDHQGRADRRRFDRHDLSAHHHPADAAGVPVGLRGARPPRHQVLRPGGRA